MPGSVASHLTTSSKAKRSSYRGKGGSSVDESLFGKVMGAPKPRPDKLVSVVGQGTIRLRDPVTYVPPASLAELDAIVVPSSEVNRVRVFSSLLSPFHL
jgi:hypothetical protein